MSNKFQILHYIYHLYGDLVHFCFIIKLKFWFVDAFIVLYNNFNIILYEVNSYVRVYESIPPRKNELT
jgi:hypothetical protein